MTVPGGDGAPLLLSDATARDLLARLGRGETLLHASPDLGAGAAPVQLDFAADEPWPSLSRAELARLAGTRERVFAFSARGVRAIEIAGPPFVKLVPTSGAPTLQIDGIKMHRTEGIDPLEDAERKLDGVVRRGDRVLDTCGGLGYGAVRAAVRGAAFVLSSERSSAVLALARENPWSAPWFRGGPLAVVRADAAELVETLPAACFDAILHDPPRFPLAGELYGDRFYAALRRLLRRRGRLFHYVGKPDSGYGARLFPSVERRLAAAGFTVRRAPERYGLTAVAC